MSGVYPVHEGIIEESFLSNTGGIDLDHESYFSNSVLTIVESSGSFLGLGNVSILFSPYSFNSIRKTLFVLGGKLKACGVVVHRLRISLQY